MFRIIFPKMVFRLEQWKWNKEYRVYVSTLGNFKDEHKNNLPFLVNNSGYLVVKTEYGYKLAHRLVMLTWKPIPNAEELTVDHLNHNKRENTLQNLEWVSKEENWERAKRDQIYSNVKTGPALGRSKKNPLVFDTVDAAFEWLLAHDKAFGNQPNLNAESVKKKLKHASCCKQKYANKFWKITNIEG